MKTKCKEYFFISHLDLLEWSQTTGTSSFLIRAITYQLTMSAHSQQSEQQNITDKMHTWQQYSVTISEDILTTKCSFSVDCTAKHRWQDRVSCMRTSVRAITKLALWWSNICWFPTLLPPLHSVAWDTGGGKQSKYSANFSARESSLAESRMWFVTLCLLL